MRLSPESPLSATPLDVCQQFGSPPVARAWITYCPYLACAVCRDIGSIVAWMTGGGMLATVGTYLKIIPKKPQDHTHA